MFSASQLWQTYYTRRKRVAEEMLALFLVLTSDTDGIHENLTHRSHHQSPPDRRTKKLFHFWSKNKERSHSLSEGKSFLAQFLCYFAVVFRLWKRWPSKGRGTVLANPSVPTKEERRVSAPNSDSRYVTYLMLWRFLHWGWCDGVPSKWAESVHQWECKPQHSAGEVLRVDKLRVQEDKEKEKRKPKYESSFFRFYILRFLFVSSFSSLLLPLFFQCFSFSIVFFLTSWSIDHIEPSISSSVSFDISRTIQQLPANHVSLQIQLFSSLTKSEAISSQKKENKRKEQKEGKHKRLKGNLSHELVTFSRIGMNSLRSIITS